MGARKKRQEVNKKDMNIWTKNLFFAKNRIEN